MKVWHISDVHLSFLEDGSIKKDMSMRRWSIGSWTYVGYLDKMEQYAATNISEDDITVITGDITHDMKQKDILHSLKWLRKIIKGTIVVIRGNHDVYWDVGTTRRGLPEGMILIDEGETASVGPYLFGCFSNHKEKTVEFTNMASDGRYLEMAFNVVKQAKEKKKIPVMVSHYPANPELATAIGKAGVKAYMSGHVHCTGADEPGNINGVSWIWYDKSAKLTDDQVIEGCFFSTGTTDVLLAKHGVSFKHISRLDQVTHQQSSAPVEETTIKSPDEIIVLVGLPGSGKSTVAKVLEGKDYVRINQDEIGTRRNCIHKADAALNKGMNVVIDRCNFNVEQRESWITLAKKHKVPKVRCLVFQVPTQVAIDRASARVDHPTIKDAITAANVIPNIEKQLVLPEMTEGFTEILYSPAGATIENTLEILLGKAKPHGEG